MSTHGAPVCWLGLRRLFGLRQRLLRPSNLDADVELEGVAATASTIVDSSDSPSIVAVMDVKECGEDTPAVCEVTKVKPNVDYSYFERLVKEEDVEESQPLSVAISGRQGWNAEGINGVYTQDGSLNGRPRLRKRDGTRWLKFNDAKQWMLSRFPDGRPLGEAFADEAPMDPREIRGCWRVCSEAQTWDEDRSISVTSGHCAGCGKQLLRVLRCSRCRTVSYCDIRCQKADWRFHQRLCRRPNVSGSGEQNLPKECRKEASEQTRAEEASTPAAKPAHVARDNRPRNWEERDLIPWARKRLEALLAGPEADATHDLPALRVVCRDGGNIEVTGVQEVEGFAAAWPNQGERRNLFDLTFEVKFKATWITDFGATSSEGTVTFSDFTSNLVADPHAVCGMEVYFAYGGESPFEKSRVMVQKSLKPAHRTVIEDGLGASQWAVVQGQGLMHLVHLRLRSFAEDFEAQ
eukprot:TRINITY_DN61547_c0_g1_i1.p1 TRINITY_DN61547_c0_g1~~TRINITY_DN61547_c0_g1_i1.p1  ORF type:complete len:464 (+),score=93.34 TRINITY_DN61547_c0_g1_i1:29-1420(+)